jgi:hypothetical protein
MAPIVAAWAPIGQKSGHPHPSCEKKPTHVLFVAKYVAFMAMLLFFLLALDGYTGHDRSMKTIIGMLLLISASLPAEPTGDFAFYAKYFQLKQQQEAFEKEGKHILAKKSEDAAEALLHGNLKDKKILHSSRECRFYRGDAGSSGANIDVKCTFLPQDGLFNHNIAIRGVFSCGPHSQMPWMCTDPKIAEEFENLSFGQEFTGTVELVNDLISKYPWGYNTETIINARLLSVTPVPIATTEIKEGSASDSLENVIKRIEQGEDVPRELILRYLRKLPATDS